MPAHARRGGAFRVLQVVSPRSMTFWPPPYQEPLRLALACYPLTLPNALLGVHSYLGTGYDDGVYLGAAMRFVHGVLPYRDFVFTQPPGIVLLLSPVALIGRATGTADAMAIGRVLTACVLGADAARRTRAPEQRNARDGGRWRIAGALSALGRRRSLAPPRALPRAVLPPRHRHRLRPRADTRRGGWPSRPRSSGSPFSEALGGAAGTPLRARRTAELATSPRRGGVVRRRVRPAVRGLLRRGTACFVHLVFSDQIGRRDVIDTLSFTQRLVMITGIGGLGNIGRSGVGVVISVAVVAATVLTYALRYRSVSRFEWFVPAALVVVLAGMSASPEFYDHYAYFPASLGALLLGIVAGNVGDAARRIGVLARSQKLRSPSVGLAGAVVAAALIAAFVVPHILRYSRNYVAGAYDPSAEMPTLVIPPGSCVIPTTRPDVSWPAASTRPARAARRSSTRSACSSPTTPGILLPASSLSLPTSSRPGSRRSTTSASWCSPFPRATTSLGRTLLAYFGITSSSSRPSPMPTSTCGSLDRRKVRPPAQPANSLTRAWLRRAPET